MNAWLEVSALNYYVKNKFTTRDTKIKLKTVTLYVQYF